MAKASIREPSATTRVLFPWPIDAKTLRSTFHGTLTKIIVLSSLNSGVILTQSSFRNFTVFFISALQRLIKRIINVACNETKVCRPPTFVFAGGLYDMTTNSDRA